MLPPPERPARTIADFCRQKGCTHGNPLRCPEAMTCRIEYRARIKAWLKERAQWEKDYRAWKRLQRRLTDQDRRLLHLFGTTP